jgi:two-component system heavy metal sensor histidine kinase CusS
LLNLSRDPEWINIQVKDFGCGIPAESLSQVGERFFKVDPSRSQASSGTGLGLSIVKGILNIHGGSMHVASEVNKGTTITLKFPV